MTSSHSRCHTWCRALIIAAIGSLVFAGDAPAQTGSSESIRQHLFERAFGDAAKPDPAMIAKVKKAKPGEYVLVDKDGDGKHEEVWFIDTSPRHTAAVQPLLVRAIDEDGDLDADGRPDLDSDLYIADWKADGNVDAVVDYTDTDHDNDVDAMGIYYWSPKDHFLGKDALRVWWGRDDSDDNQLWYDVNYSYSQPACQWRCNFSGDETFVAFGLTEGTDHWESIFENPFLFFDINHNGCSDEVIRFSGWGNQEEALRWSFDADDDAHGRRTHDYDFSITALAPGSRWVTDGKTAASDLKIPESLTENMTLRGIPTGGWLRRENAREFARVGPWTKAVLTWDEINANTDEDTTRDPHERWEGVIVHKSENFPQMGGPPCSALNKRNELLTTSNGPLRVYMGEKDHRLHLFGANTGWTHVDFDLDGKTDAEYEYVGNDGHLQTMRADVNADGVWDFDCSVGSPSDVALRWEEITQTTKAALTSVLEQNGRFIDAARAALGGTLGIAEPVEQFFLTKLESWVPATQLGAHVRKSPAGARFYTDLMCDRLLYELKKRLGDRPAWKQIAEAYSNGDRGQAAGQILKELAGDSKPIDPARFGAFTRRIPLRIDNTAGNWRDEWPVVISLKELKATAPDFNPGNCAVVAPERWIDWREVPHQVDAADPAAGDELSFLVDLPAKAAATWYLYYSPEGTREMKWPHRTATAEDWVPPNIGWESERIAYRTYYGQFDFFGKKLDRLIYPTIGKVSYHSETDWGIDALNSSSTSGVGGVTIYLDGKAYPVMNPINKGEVKITKQQLVAGPVRCAIRVDMSNIVPDRAEIALHLVLFLYAGHQESEIRASVSGTSGEVILAPGFMKLRPSEQIFADPKAGCFGSWGFQIPGIGEIGLGMIGPPSQYVATANLPDERRYQWRAPDAKLRYWITADWRRGRQYPVGPTIQNWSQEMHALAGSLLNEPSLGIKPAEPVGP